MDDDVRKLIEFLAEDCGWPLEEEQIDRSAWPVNNAELGLNDEVSIDSVEIFELRPLTTHQPWGVFFVAVKGTSNLSMTLLRKLLRGLVKKKRASADTSNLQQWNLEDLMFVCSLDEPENTTRYFAHFKEQEKGLPKLMIGARWQDSQPENEINAAKLKLKNNLKWPDNEANIDSWREQWGKAFPIGHKEVIKSSSILANALAKYAVIIKRSIPEIYSIESDNGPVHRLFEAFKEALISDLEIDDFADMVAQTITYGLFSAKATGSELTGIETLSECIPATNPFLKDLFSELSKLSGTEPTDLDFDDLAINDLVLMLNETNIDAVLDDFGNRFKGGKEDPVIHFYETFLSKYDHDRRVERGVFYTPKPVVEFMVRSAHERLIEDFGLPLGLADTSTHIVNGEEWFKVMILDPATGTGTYLEETIDIIHKTMVSHWKDLSKGKLEISVLWNEYVNKHLLPRLYGFELMMAPYSIAHLKLGMKLLQTGYKMDSKIRLNVYLTNTLSPPAPLGKWLPDFISEESKVANIAKSKIPFSVILGNPPYSKLSGNLSEQERRIVNRYKFIEGRKIKEKGALQFEMNLQDDYIKFYSLCESIIGRTGFGVIGLITNNGFLDNITLRGMRYSILQTFDNCEFINLHGNIAGGEVSPEGIPEENVFDIITGVAISICSTSSPLNNNKTILKDVYGTREEKYKLLKTRDLESVNITPMAPLFKFQMVDYELNIQWENWISLEKLFPRNSAGFISSRDNLLISMDKPALLHKIRQFGEAMDMPEDEVYNKFGFKKSKRLVLRDAQAEVKKDSELEDRIIEIQYRPFDFRYVYYHRRLIESFKPIAFNFNIENNLAILATRQVTRNQYEHSFVTNRMIEIKACSHDRNTQLFPFMVFKNENESGSEIRPNMNKQLFKSICNHLSLPGNYVCDINYQNGQAVIPSSIFYYSYAILHSPFYRQKNFQFLKTSFPRIPFTSNNKLFFELVKLGSDLMSLHLLHSNSDNLKSNNFEFTLPLDNPKCEFIEGSNGRVIGSVSKVKSFSDGKIFIDKNSLDSGSYFSGISESVWEFMIGGYQVCHKWLHGQSKNGDKLEMKLTDEDILHFIRMVKSIQCTLYLTKEIDEVIERHGGWPLEGSDEFEVPDERDENQTGLFDF